MNGTVKMIIFVAVTICSLTATAAKHELVERESEYGKVLGYKDTPLLPWTDNKYRVHDPDRPVPKHVETGEISPTAAPADAIILFDGKDLDQWQPSSWKLVDGGVEAGQGSLETKDAFGSCRLHIEWMVPTSPPKHMMSRGNSGVFFMRVYEIQIFDSHPSHAEHIYPDGQTAAIYGETPPLVNACRKPGEWQSFDIEFTAPVFEDGKLVKRARVTMRHNGVEVHRDQEIMGPCAHLHIRPYDVHAAKLPLTLQGHGSPVRFRNIWICPLD
jgi:hypothetical protein